MIVVHSSQLTEMVEERSLLLTRIERWYFFLAEFLIFLIINIQIKVKLPKFFK